jgi:tetratricopeptide (TPR) repeat protein
MENCVDALGCYQSALKIARVALCADLADEGTAASREGDGYAAQGLLAKALTCYCRALDLRRQTYGENSKNVALSFHEIGCIYSVQGRYMESLEAYGKALQIFHAFSR